MNTIAIIVCCLASISAIFEVLNKNYIAANWAVCTAVWAGIAIS